MVDLGPVKIKERMFKKVKCQRRGNLKQSMKAILSISFRVVTLSCPATYRIADDT